MVQFTMISKNPQKRTADHSVLEVERAGEEFH
jgi:hypothetical protein